jgi:hypothetical protein
MTPGRDPLPTPVGQGVRSVREKCAGRGCEHARSSHDPDTGECLVCDRCRGWALSRPHLWREYVTTTYWHARDQWETMLDLEASTTWRPGLITREQRRARRGGRREVTDFIEKHPPPTFRDHLVAQAGTFQEAS